MFKIYDGRSEFYQWDLNRKLIVADKSVTQVHFCNRTGSCSLMRDVYEANGMYLVDVPNILLQDNWDIKVYGFDSSYTKHSTTYNVVPRTRPENYVYSETEQLKWEQLEERIDQIEENGVSDEVVANAVEKYMDENDIKVDLTGYATEEYVQEQIEGIEIPEVDLTGYATEDYVGKKIAEAQLEGEDVDLSVYYTKTETNAEITKAINGIVHPKPDLTNYYTKSETNTAINNAKPDLTKYALKTEIPSTAGLATESYVQDEISKIEHPSTDLSNYYTKQETKDYVANAIEQIEIPEGGGGTGESIKEVHVGSDAPTDASVKLWVQPDAESPFALKSDLTGFVNATQVQTAITNALSAIGVAEEGAY